MYLTSSADYTPGTAPGVFGRDVKDHQLTRYAQALRAAINRYHEVRLLFAVPSIPGAQDRGWMTDDYMCTLPLSGEPRSQR